MSLVSSFLLSLPPTPIPQENNWDLWRALFCPSCHPAVGVKADKATQSTNLWPGLILLSASTLLLSEGAWLFLCPFSFASTKNNKLLSLEQLKLELSNFAWCRSWHNEWMIAFAEKTAAKAPDAFELARRPPKVASSPWRAAPHLILGSPKWHLDQFSHFCRAHDVTNRQTYTQIDHHGTSCVAIGSCC